MQLPGPPLLAIIANKETIFSAQGGRNANPKRQSDRAF